MQCACAILSFVNCMVLLHYSTLSHKQLNFWKDVVQHKMCVLIFFTNLSETFLVVTRTEQYIMVRVLRSSSKAPVILFRF